jgi:hypothetical protein
MESISRLIEAAAEYPADSLAKYVPCEWLSEIKASTSKPPKSPDDVLFLWGGMLIPGTDAEAFMAEKRRIWHSGACNWHKYFEE